MIENMASLHKDPQGRSPFWFCAYSVRGPDGRMIRKFRSTKVKDKKTAWQVCNAWAKSGGLGGALTPERAREVIAQGVADAMLAAGQSLPTTAIGDWCNRWLATKEIENQQTTHSRYKLAIGDFLDFLGPRSSRDLDTLRPDDVLRFRDACAKRLAVGSVNTSLNIVRACLNTAVRQGFAQRNVASQVSGLKERGESKRRALTLAEIQKVLEVCGDSPWRGLVLVGLYTGQRLGDCGRLTWGQVDLGKQEVSFVTEKTGKRLSMALAKPLAEYLEGLPSADTTDAPVFPGFAEMIDTGGISRLSNAFASEVLIPAGLMAPRAPKHKATGVGRSGRRQINPVTFHSLRHSFVTMLKATGASNAMAEMIVGHDSPAVSARYTHLAAGDTVDPISKLPDVTAKQ